MLAYRLTFFNLSKMNHCIGLYWLQHKIYDILFMKKKVIYLKIVNSIKSDLLIALAECRRGPLIQSYLKKLPGFKHWPKGGKKKDEDFLYNFYSSFNSGEKKEVKVCAAVLDSFVLRL